MVFNFLNLEGAIREQAREFVINARKNSQWVNDGLMQFFSFQLQRVARGEISKNTIPNYYKAIKLFCEMNDLLLNWKKISRVLPKRRNAANDRAPTLEEIRRLIEYPDRRIKPIVYTMVSSGIRIGAWDDLHIMQGIARRFEIYLYHDGSFCPCYVSKCVTHQTSIVIVENDKS
jgi:integrase